MSAPQTDIEKQKRRHFTPLVGIGLAVAFGFGMFLLWMFGVFEGAESPQDAATQTPDLLPPGSDAIQDAEIDQSGQAGEPMTDEAQTDDAGGDTTVGD